MQPSKVHRLASFLGVLLLCAAAVAYAKRVPAAAPPTAPITSFSATRAMVLVQALAAWPHPTGSLPNEMTRVRIMDELRSLGLNPTEQRTTGIGTRYAAVGRISNILVRIPGAQPGGLAVVLMAHYDAVPAGPGAGDDASGCAVLLETVRALRWGKPLTHDVIALFTDGEEAGLLGAAAFVREHPWAKDVGVILNFEARGTRGPSLMFETGPGNLDVARVLRGVPGVRATSLSTAVYRKLPNDTDLSELAALGRPALNFAFIGGADRYHTAQDDPWHLDPRSVQHQGNNALALTRAFANGPLPRPATSDAVFFDFPVLGLVVYRESWALPLAILGLLLAFAVVNRVRGRDHAWVRDAAVGATATILSLVLAGGVAFGVATILQRLHAALASGAPEWSSLYAAAVALLALSVMLASLALARRGRFGADEGLHGGALLVWASISVLVALSAPGASFVFTWPLIITALGCLAASWRADALTQQAVRWVSTAISLFIVVPVVYLMACTALGLDATGATVLGVFTALIGWLVVAPLQPAQDEARHTAPAIAAAAAIALLLAGASTVRTNADHPAGASLIYAVDADSNAAFLTGYAWGAGARSALRRVLHAASPASAVPPPAWLRRGGVDSRSVIRAPIVPFESPSATVLSDSTTAGRRVLSLRIRPGRGTGSVSMAADGGPILGATVDDKPITTERYRVAPRRWSLSYTAPPDSGFTLVLTMPTTSRPTLGILSQRVGLPPLPEMHLSGRPPGIMPVQGGDVTLVYYRIRL